MNRRGAQIRLAHSDAGHGAASVSDMAIAAGVEAEEMDASGIFRAVMAVAVLVVVIVIAVFQMVNLEVQDVRGDMAAASQSDVLTNLRLSAVQKLNRYERLTNAEGRYRIPIDRAMELISREANSRPASGFSAEMVLLRE